MRVTRVAWVLLFVTVLGALAWAGCEPADAAEATRVRPPTTQVQHLRAFAKLYGHLRYFHPSDEASAIDWDRLAIHGVDRVAAGDAAHLRQVLDELFVPVAPTLQIFPSGDTPPDIALPAASADTKVVAWQHVGFGQGTIRSAYRSARTNRGESPDKPLFSGAPAPGETVTKVLGAGLSCRYPLVLPSIRGHTWGPPRRPIQPLQRVLAGIDPTRLKADDQRVRLAGVVIAWNVFQHFYPYFDAVKVDWDVVLTQALQRALADRTHADFARTLNWLVAQLQDGHGHVRHPADRYGWVPWRLEWIEDQVVVTAARPDTKLLPGDVVRTVGSQPAVELMREREEYISGSPQWRRYRALESLSAGPASSPLEVTVRRGTEIRTLRLPRGGWSMPERAGPPMRQLAGGIWYVDLDQVPWEQILPKLTEIAAAPGVIFDLRGYPKDNHTVIQHLLRADDRSTEWMQVAQIVRPDRERLFGHEKHSWGLTRQSPHIKGRVAFITGPQAISYAESVMSFIEHYRLAEIVGQPTAGTNGNINRFPLPGGFQVTFTGMKVLKHDGSQLFHVGIRPTVPVARTIAGVRGGRDEAFEAALQVVQGKRR